MEQQIAASPARPSADASAAAHTAVAIGGFAVAFVVALALTLTVALDDRPPGDVRLIREVGSWPFPHWLADATRAVTTTQVVLVCGYVAAAALFMLGARREAIALAAAIFVLPLLQAGLKDLVDRPRPTEAIVPQRAGYTSESFPAGHVMSPTALYGYVTWLAAAGLLPSRLRALRWPLVAWSVAVLALTGFVSVWLGVHWPTDVLGGYAWGAALALVAVVAATARWRRPT